MWATPITLLFRLASRTPVQQAGQLSIKAIYRIKRASDFTKNIRVVAVSSGLDLGGLLQVLSMGVHLSQHSADPVVLHAQFLNPLLVVSTGLRSAGPRD